MELYVGLAGFRGRIERYAFDLLEMPVSATLPRAKVLRHLREAKPKLAFSLRLPPEVIEGGEGAEELIERTLAAATILEARFIVISSGVHFRPTTKNRERLRQLCERLKADSRRIAWEPRGVWTNEELEEWIGELGVILVRDLTREPDLSEDVAYTRLLPYGLGAKVTQHAIEKLSEALESKSEAYVVIQGEGARGARTKLREWLGIDTDDTDDEE